VDLCRSAITNILRKQVGLEVATEIMSYPPCQKRVDEREDEEYVTVRKLSKFWRENGRFLGRLEREELPGSADDDCVVSALRHWQIDIGLEVAVWLEAVDTRLRQRGFAIEMKENLPLKLEG